MQALVDVGHLLGLQELARHVAQESQHLGVRVDPRLALVLAVVHELTDHPHHPNDSQQVIHMLVRHEDMPHVHPVVASVLELGENPAAAPAVHHEARPAIVQNKAGVVALGDERVTGPKHRKLHRFGPTFANRRRRKAHVLAPHEHIISHNSIVRCPPRHRQGKHTSAGHGAPPSAPASPQTLLSGHSQSQAHQRWNYAQPQEPTRAQSPRQLPTCD